MTARLPATLRSRVIIGVAVGGATASWLAPALSAIGPIRSRVAPCLSGRSSARHVALTFDDGPDPASTPYFLDLLAAHQVRATFFVLGAMVERAPEVAARIAAEGHELAVHGWDHLATPLRSHRRLTADLRRTVELLEAVGGTVPRWYRPPYGVMSRTAYAATADTGLRPVLWTAWGRDWTASATPESIVRAVRRRPSAGATVLLHDSDVTSAPGSWRRTLDALPPLLEGWRADAVAVGTLSEHAGAP